MNDNWPAVTHHQREIVSIPNILDGGQVGGLPNGTQLFTLGLHGIVLTRDSRGNNITPGFMRADSNRFTTFPRNDLTDSIKRKANETFRFEHLLNLLHLFFAKLRRHF